MAASNHSIKLLMDSRNKKVLLAEAGKDFVDFLFCIMSLPVGSLISLLRKHGNVGSLNNLYRSIEKLDRSYLQPNQKKETLLNPRPSVTAANFPLLLGDSLSMDRQLYGSAGDCDCVTDVSGTKCTCGNSLIDECEFVAGNAAAVSPSEGGFVKSVVTYMVMDDLTVQPMSSISSITLLSKLKVKDIGCLEEKVVNIGIDKVIELLKASLGSQTVLTDVFA